MDWWKDGGMDGWIAEEEQIGVICIVRIAERSDSTCLIHKCNTGYALILFI